MAKGDETRVSQAGEGRVARWPRGRCASEWATVAWPYEARCIGEPGHEPPCMDRNGHEAPAPVNTTPGMTVPALGAGTLLAIVSRRVDGTVVVSCMHARCTVAAELVKDPGPNGLALARVVDHAATGHD